MSDPRLDVHVTVVVTDDEQTIGIATAASETLLRPDGAVDGLVDKIAERKIAAAKALLRRSRNR